MKLDGFDLPLSVSTYLLLNYFWYRTVRALLLSNLMKNGPPSAAGSLSVKFSACVDPQVSLSCPQEKLPLDLVVRLASSVHTHTHTYSREIFEGCLTVHLPYEII